MTHFYKDIKHTLKEKKKRIFLFSLNGNLVEKKICKTREKNTQAILVYIVNISDNIVNDQTNI